MLDQSLFRWSPSFSFITDYLLISQEQIDCSMFLASQMPWLTVIFQYIIINSTMILLDRYQLIKAHGEHTISVGFGSYGQVKLAIDTVTKRNVAVKIVHKLAKNEVDYHQQLYHENIIQLLGYYLDKEKQITYMILEYADGGTLFEKIRNQKLSKKEIKSYFKDVCEAVAYLHRIQIMHRDIKPENILLTSKGQAKLCDFGFAAILGERKTLCGTYQYMSPEMIQNRPYDYKIDIWALGILLFQLISGRAPFKGKSPDQVLDQMKTKIFFGDRFIPEQIDLIKSILRVTPSKRPTIKQILQHPYFSMQDTVSTKQSEISNKQSKQLKSQLFTKNFHSQQQIQMTKPIQQNSYPFDVSKSKQGPNQPLPFVPKVGEKSPIKNVQKTGLNTSFGPSYRNQIMMQQQQQLPMTEFNNTGFMQKPNTSLNFSNNAPHYRHS